MRNLVGILLVGLALFLLVTVVLPVLGFLLAAVVALLAIGAVAYFAAPLLARLPWFRDRIKVEEHGGARTVRFGRTQFSSFGDWSAAPRAAREPADDVIDVEGRTVGTEDDAAEVPPDLLPDPGRRE